MLKKIIPRKVVRALEKGSLNFLLILIDFSNFFSGKKKKKKGN